MVKVEIVKALRFVGDEGYELSYNSQDVFRENILLSLAV